MRKFVGTARGRPVESTYIYAVLAQGARTSRSILLLSAVALVPKTPARHDGCFGLVHRSTVGCQRTGFAAAVAEDLHAAHACMVSAVAYAFSS
jgi:hypothetical protein